MVVDIITFLKKLWSEIPVERQISSLLLIALLFVSNEYRKKDVEVKTLQQEAVVTERQFRAESNAKDRRCDSIVDSRVLREQNRWIASTEARLKENKEIMDEALENMNSAIRSQKKVRQNVKKSVEAVKK